jgi:YbgC/YbaW family acyl-CoA thioester hydrolase
MAPPFSIRRRVEFCETDLAGILHFSNFFRYMESAEHAYLRSLGFSVHGTTEAGTIGWPRVQTRCEYFKPLTFEEEVEVEVLVAEVRSRSVRYLFGFWKSGPQWPVLAARGETSTVCVRMNEAAGRMEATAIPEDLHAALEPAPPEALERLYPQPATPTTKQ